MKLDQLFGIHARLLRGCQRLRRAHLEEIIDFPVISSSRVNEHVIESSEM
jgi:hypothetical protein